MVIPAVIWQRRAESVLALNVRPLLCAALVVALVQSEVATWLFLVLANASIEEHAQPLSIWKFAGAAIRHVCQHLLDRRAIVWGRRRPL